MTIVNRVTSLRKPEPWQYVVLDELRGVTLNLSSEQWRRLDTQLRSLSAAVADLHREPM